MSPLEFKPIAILCEFNEHDINTANTIIEILDEENQDPEDIHTVINLLINASERTLYALSTRYEKLNSFLDTHEDLKQQWKTRLQTLKYPHHAIISFDKTESLSLFSQLKGAFLLGEFLKNPDYSNSDSMNYLNLAAEIGIFHALVLRLNHTSTIVSTYASSNKSSIEMQKQIDLVRADAARLSNLYWSIGSLDASHILFSIVNSLYSMPGHQLSIFQTLPADPSRSTFSWQTQFYNPGLPYPVQITKDAIEYLYIAELLSGLPQSQQLIQEITNSNEIKVKVDGTYISIEAFRNMVMEKLDTLHIPYKESFCGHALRSARDKLQQYYPQAALRT